MSPSLAANPIADSASGIAIGQMLDHMLREDRQRMLQHARFWNTYGVGKPVCEYGALFFRLKRLKKVKCRVDDSLDYVNGRVIFTTNALVTLKYDNGRHVLVNKNRTFVDEQAIVERRSRLLIAEIAQVESLLGNCAPCERCNACLTQFKRWRLSHGRKQGK